MATNRRRASPEKARKLLAQRAKILATEEGIKKLKTRLASQRGELKSMRAQK